MIVAVIVTVGTTLGPDLFDIPAIQDDLREWRDADDFRYAVDYNDPAIQLVLPAGVDLTAKQAAYLKGWSLAREGARNSDEKVPDLLKELREIGAATPVDVTHIAISVEGRRRQPIHVDAIYPVQIHRTAPYSGTLVNITPEGGGDTLQMMFNFDEITPRARTTIDGDDVSGAPLKPGVPYFDKHTLTIEDGKEDEINIAMTGTRYAVSFKIRIDYRIGGQRRHQIIGYGERPFLVTPFNCVDPAPRDKRGNFVMAKDGRDIVMGHISYDHIWAYGRNGIESKKNTHWFEFEC
ncbi:hypothetical protein [Sphaerisporangium rhizosphaerae]|uniref:Uncharacterized protein n=1 Tax=Sphaerisporangium rhizosphaerae TaxID=2269375 RepID=A0ABW2NZJ8_9ACTN